MARDQEIAESLAREVYYKVVVIDGDRYPRIVC